MPNKKECNCCMKRSYNVSKCFVNNTCNWKSCAACIVKQIKMEDILTCKYDCPNCRQPSEYRKHSRFTKWSHQNRGAMKRIIDLQGKLLRMYDDRLKNISYLSNTTFLWESYNENPDDDDAVDENAYMLAEDFNIQDIAGNFVEINDGIEISPDLPPPDLVIDEIDTPVAYPSSPSSSSL